MPSVRGHGHGRGHRDCGCELVIHAPRSHATHDRDRDIQTSLLDSGLGYGCECERVDDRETHTDGRAADYHDRDDDGDPLTRHPEQIDREYGKHPSSSMRLDHTDLQVAGYERPQISRSLCGQIGDGSLRRPRSCETSESKTVKM